MTRVIEIDARAEQGRILLDIPADVPDGPVHLVVTIAPTGITAGPEAPISILDQLQMITNTGWPLDATFSREELYGDDGL